MALRVTFLRLDFDPRVATSLYCQVITYGTDGNAIPDSSHAILTIGQNYVKSVSMQ